MVAASAGLTQVKEFLTQHGAGFMLNTRYVPGDSCPRCKGIPNPGYASCYPCNFDYPGVASDRVGILAYAVAGHQSGAVMRAYKAEHPGSTAVDTVQFMLAYALIGHEACLVDPMHGPPTLWATVPSLPARAGSHPLHALANRVLGSKLPVANLVAAPKLIGPARRFTPANYVASGVAGHHVLLIEDTWASGAHVESAAAALKAAGATAVTTLVVSRWMDPSRHHTWPFLTAHTTTPYDPDICPVTGVYC